MLDLDLRTGSVLRSSWICFRHFVEQFSLFLQETSTIKEQPKTAIEKPALSAHAGRLPCSRYVCVACVLEKPRLVV